MPKQPVAPMAMPKAMKMNPKAVKVKPKAMPKTMPKVTANEQAEACSE